jgi:hypothetical protein
MANLLENNPKSMNLGNEIPNSCFQMELLFNSELHQLEPDINTTFKSSTGNDHGLANWRIDVLPTLPAELSYHGFQYTLVCRGFRSYVYHQTLGKKSIGYEVFKIRIQPEAVLYGKFYPARERWPKDDDFSKTAWSCWTLKEAMLKFNALES